MAGYMIIDAQVVDAERLPAFATKVAEAVSAHGGRFLARGGQVDSVHGDWVPQRLVIVEFDSFEAARDCVNSPEYGALDSYRDSAVTSNVVITEGVSAD